MNQELTILQLYPDELNIYGDNGNLLTLIRRLEWRNIAVNVLRHNIGDNFSHYMPDIIIAGGGQDSNQVKIGEDLSRLRDQLRQWIEAGVPCLMICGAYQALGKPYQNKDGVTMPGLELIDIKTKVDNERLIGNLIIKSEEFGRIIGYENHSGRTYLGDKLKPLGKVTRGGGNNGHDGTEGLRYKNLIGTYCHGPILPKNPRVADFLITKALERKYGSNIKLTPLDDAIELAAQDQSANRPR
ncbi:MAG: type 1 glutamine amidotransferase [Candidatus Nanosyncoccaceae bacterium]|jgi:CobQ-like glutamine amidotransferase family enzyme